MSATYNDETQLYEAEIEGRTYAFAKWGSEESVEALMDLAEIAQRPFALAAAEVAREESDLLAMDIAPESLAQIFEAAAVGVTGNRKTVMRLLKKLCSGQVLCEHKTVNFNAHYKGDLAEMFRVASANLEVQYGNFFGAMRSVVAAHRSAAKATAAKSSLTSIGSSGAPSSPDGAPLRRSAVVGA